MSPFRSIGGAYRAAFAGLPRDVWLLCGISLVNRAGTMVLPFLGLFLREARGLSMPAAGGLVAVYGLGSLAGSYLGGWMADRFGSIRTQQLSLLGAGAGYLLILQFQDISALAVMIFATSTVAEAFRPAVMTSVAHRAPAGASTQSFALLRLAANVGMAIGPGIGGVLAVYDYDLLFVLDGATCWAAAVLLWWLLPGARAGTSETGGRPEPGDRSPWADGPFLGLVILVAAFAACLFQAFSTVPFYLRDAYGLREDRIGLVLVFNAALIVVFEMVLIHRLRSRRRMPLIGAGALLVTTGLALLPLGSTLAFALLTTVVWTAGEMLFLPLTTSAAADRAGPRTRGRYLGLYSMAFSLAFIVAPVAGTWVLDRFGGGVLWLGIGLLGIPQFLGAMWLDRTLRRAGA